MNTEKFRLARFALLFGLMAMTAANVNADTNHTADVRIGEYRNGCVELRQQGRTEQVQFVAIQMDGGLDYRKMRNAADRWAGWLRDNFVTHVSNGPRSRKYATLHDWTKSVVLVWYNRTTNKFGWYAVSLETHWQVMDNDGDKHVLKNKKYRNLRWGINGHTVGLQFHNPRNVDGFTRNHVGFFFYHN